MYCLKEKERERERERTSMNSVLKKSALQSKMSCSVLHCVAVSHELCPKKVHIVFIGKLMQEKISQKSVLRSKMCWKCIALCCSVPRTLSPESPLCLHRQTHGRECHVLQCVAVSHELCPQKVHFAFIGKLMVENAMCCSVLQCLTNSVPRKSTLPSSAHS